MLDLLALEDDVFQWCLSAQPAPTALQRSNRGKCAHLLRDLAATADLPPHSALLSQQLLDLTRGGGLKLRAPTSMRVMSILAAAASFCVKLHSARYSDPAPFQLPDPHCYFWAGANLTFGDCPNTTNLNRLGAPRSIRAGNPGSRPEDREPGRQTNPSRPATHRKRGPNGKMGKDPAISKNRTPP